MVLSESSKPMPPLPGYLAGRVMAKSSNTGFDEIDRHLVILSKRAFIAGVALSSGTDEEVLDKIEQFKSVLEQYILLSEELVYLPLMKPGQDSLSTRAKELLNNFVDLKHKLCQFIEQDSQAAIKHPMLVSRAISRIDKIVFERNTLEREHAYPVVLGA